jgi:hypothetical protein
LDRIGSKRRSKSKKAKELVLTCDELKVLCPQIPEQNQGLPINISLWSGTTNGTTKRTKWPHRKAWPVASRHSMWINGYSSQKER